MAATTPVPQSRRVDKLNLALFDYMKLTSEANWNPQNHSVMQGIDAVDERLAARHICNILTVHDSRHPTE
ncbi:hypothetical protein N7454_004236 [Penicillium verhagenii]|nr:hypothetical protein N7454_004236 [Penicillium verhagenii]